MELTKKTSDTFEHIVERYKDMLKYGHLPFDGGRRDRFEKEISLFDRNAFERLLIKTDWKRIQIIYGI
jgi:hypothetical protein